MATNTATMTFSSGQWKVSTETEVDQHTEVVFKYCDDENRTEDTRHG